MEQDKKKRQERVNYVKNLVDDRGIQVLTGKSVNYPQIIVSADTEEDLKKEAKEHIIDWLKYSSEIMEGEEDPIELREIEDPAEWLHEPNITYWEIERMKHVMKRPDVQEVWKKIIVDTLLYADDGITIDDQVTMIIEAFINSKTE